MAPSQQHKHDFHACIAEMTYKPKQKSWKVIVKIFTDDLEDHINRGQKTKLHIDFAGKDKSVDQAIEKYLNDHFYLSKKAKKSKIVYKYRKADVEATTIYFDIPLKGFSNHIKLTNSILLDYFDDQNNIVNTLYNGEKKTLLFNGSKREQSLAF